MKTIFQFFTTVGIALGRLVEIICFGSKGQYLIYVFSRALATGRYSSRFRSIGKNIKLAPGLKLGNANHISLGNNVSVMSNCVLECTGDSAEMVLGDNISIGEYSHITCAQKMVIGDGLLTGRYVLITDNSHGENLPDELNILPLARRIYSSGPVIIGRNVWIGDKATILPNVKIGDGAVVAANAVVTKDIPPFSVAVGCPAKVIKTIK